MASLKDQGGDCFGVVPPDFLGGGAEELEGRDHASRIASVRSKGRASTKGCFGWARGDEKWDLASAIGEVDGDVAEISLEALTGEMCERYECFFMSSLMLEQIALHLAVASGISVLVAETTEHLHGGVALLGGSVVVIDQI